MGGVNSGRVPLDDGVFIAYYGAYKRTKKGRRKIVGSLPYIWSRLKELTPIAYIDLKIYRALPDGSPGVEFRLPDEIFWKMGHTLERKNESRKSQAFRRKMGVNAKPDEDIMKKAAGHVGRTGGWMKARKISAKELAERLGIERPN